MISSLLFTILALAFFTLLMVINFYRRLFMDGRETYSRSELLSVTDNIIDEVKLWYNKDKKSALVGAGIGLVAELFTPYLEVYMGTSMNLICFYLAVGRSFFISLCLR